MFLHEVILYVKDMSRQVRFYRDVLGLPLVTPVEEDKLTETYWVVFQAGSCRLALHGGGEQDFGKDAPKLVFYVEDLESVRLKLQNQGVSISEPRSPAPDVLVADFADPEGNVLSLEQ